MSYDNVQVKAQAVKRALPASLDDLERAANNLSGTLQTLYGQLYPVLDAPQTLKAAGVGEDCPQQPHYASRVNDMVAMLNSMNDTAHDILGRLHV